MTVIIITNALALMVCCFISHIEASLSIKYKSKSSIKPNGPLDFITMRYLRRFASERKRATDRFNALYLMNLICMILISLLLLLLVLSIVFRFDPAAVLDKLHWSVLLLPMFLGIGGTAFAAFSDSTRENVEHSKVLFRLLLFESAVAVILAVINFSCMG